MRYFITIEGRTLEVELGADGVRLDGEPVTVDLAEVDGTQVRTLLMNHRSHSILANGEGAGAWALHLSGRPLRVGVLDERTRAIRERAGLREGAGGPKPLRAPMPGLVIKVEVREGESVFAGQGLVIVEAMKMENELKSSGEGRVKRVLASPGQTVEKDEVLVEFEALDTDSAGGEEE